MSPNESARPVGRHEPVVSIRAPGGKKIDLDLNEYRLALLLLVDFGGDWDAMRLAATLVTDGPAKMAVAHERLEPITGHLHTLLARGVDSLELLAARFWFREETVEPS